MLAEPCPGVVGSVKSQISPKAATDAPVKSISTVVPVPSVGPSVTEPVPPTVKSAVNELAWLTFSFLSLGRYVNV